MRQAAVSPNRAVNQRAMTVSAIASTLCSRTVAARSSHCSGGGRYGAVQARTSRDTRSVFAASHMPTMPPSESPQKAKRSSPSSSASASVSRASPSIVAGPDGDSPCPGWS